MVKKSKRRAKHVPQRTCVGCREVLPKRSMTRIVKGPDGIRVDPTGKAHGRGAYLHDKRSCWMRGINGALEQAFGQSLEDHEAKDLLTYMRDQIPDENDAEIKAEVIPG